VQALLLPASFAIAALVARELLGRAPNRVSADLVQPLIVVTNWGGFGAALLSLLLLAVLAGSPFYWNALRRADPFSVRHLLVALIVALGAAACMPVLFSSDVYAYAAYGELGRMHRDPYAPAPLHQSDALVSAAQWQWGGSLPICVYGPLFVAIAKFLVTAVAPLGVVAQLQGFRIVACAALIFCVLLATQAYAGDRAARLRAAATIGLNPVAIWCAVEGHNDAIALAVVLGAFVLLRRGFMGSGAALAAVAALVKLPGIAAAFAVAIVERRARVGATIGIALALLFSAPLIAGIATHLAPHGRYDPQASLQAAIASSSGFAAEGIAVVAGALLAARGVAMLRQQVHEGWIWLGLAAWVLVPNPYPWYALWLVALAAIAPRTRAGVVAILLSFTSLLRYVPDAVVATGGAFGVTLGAVAALPLLGLLFPRPGIMSDPNDPRHHRFAASRSRAR
jgi:hypothetical protein